MSGIGFWELIILALIGLLVLGPERLPRVANQLGGWLGQARRMTRVMKRQLEDELDFEKDLGLKKAMTPKQSVSEPQYVHNESVNHDDDYSPAHDGDSVGTGVNDDPVDIENAPESSDITASTSTTDDAESAEADKKTPA
ncbi:MAG: twin-arginine translocase subunit TatB [Gammaproteobacteria bacterium]|nr:twin-arginine translocase subunit TatB [Gammaproteobacteria bacterium]